MLEDLFPIRWILAKIKLPMSVFMSHLFSTDEFESDEFDGDLHDVWRPKKKKKVRPERTRPPPERISSRLSGKAKKTYTEETPYG